MASELASGLAEYRTARARCESSAVAAAAAREARRVARESYEQGVALLTDLLDAQRQEAEAQLLEVEAFYDARIQAARLARALGQLPTEEWAAGAAAADSTEN